MLGNFTEQLSRWILRGAQFLRSKFIRRTFFSFAIVAVLFAVFVVAHPVGADDGLISGFADGLINGLSSILIEIAAIFIQLTIFALKFFIEIAGYNNYIDADIVKLGWNMIRDVANMFFVVILLVIAFGTILGLEQYEWKKTLVKLIMAAFLVNFSNLICQVIIDVSQVFTITFLNAVAGAAGGNLIKMFNLDEIYKISYAGASPQNLPIQLFGGAVMTVIFAGMAMFTIGAYLIVIIARMVVLWTLMILSPLAFLFSALPNTQSYAQEFWNEFIHHVIVAPVMVFFLWLAFATFGGGDVVQQNIEKEHPLIISNSIDPITRATDTNNQSLGASFSQAASWENMANFAVAIAFLWIGIERVQKLGVVGGGIVSGAISFGKNVATLASGYAIGRWLAKGGSGLATKGIKSALWYAPLVGGEKWQRRFKNEVAGLKSWYYDTGYRPKVKRNEDGTVKLNEKTGKAEYDLDEFGQPQMELDPDRGGFQKFIHYFARKDIEGAKKLEKTTKYAELQKELLDKGTTGIPKFLLMKDSEKLDALDRFQMGRLEGEKRRSAGKTAEWSAKGQLATLRNPRYKDGKLDPNDPRGSVIEQEVRHKTEADTASNFAHALEEETKDKILHAGRDSAVKVSEAIAAIEEQKLTDPEKAAQQALTDAKLKTRDIEAQAKVKVEMELNKLDEGFAPERRNLSEQKDRAAGLLKDGLGGYGLALTNLKEQAKAAGLSDDDIKSRVDAFEATKSNFIDPTSGKTIAALEADAKLAEDAFNQAMSDQRKKKEAKTQEIRSGFDQQIEAGGFNVEAKEKALEQAKKNAEEERRNDPAKAQAYAEKVAALEQQKQDLQTNATRGQDKAGVGLRYAAGKQWVATAKAQTDQAEEELREASLGIEMLREMFNDEQSAKIGAQAAKSFVEGIQEEEVGKIFKKGSVDFKKAMEKAFKEGAAGLKEVKLGFGKVGARLAKSQVLSEYAKDIAQVNKKTTVDEADSAFTLERYGFDAPASSFNEWVKKRMESFQGVEREQAVRIAINSLSKLQTMSAKGETLDRDQEAQMMANVKYLTSQAWSDDLLARITSTIQRKNKGELYGQDKDEAQKLEDVFIKTLKWGEHDENGNLIKLDNRSGFDRTNDLHRLAAFGGDVGLVQAENAVLRHSEETGLGYTGAANSLATKLANNGVVALVSQLNAAKASNNAAQVATLTNQIGEIAKTLGINSKTAVEEVASFSNRYLTSGMTDFTKAVSKFESEIKRFSEATQMMSDFKNLAGATGHIDDGGHVKFDMDTGYAHGQLSHKALDFMLSDWRKKSLDNRLSTLKSHSIMYMDEDTGTASIRPEHLQAFRETFQGMEKELSFKRLDGRVIDHLATLAPGELPILNNKGRMVMGDSRSVVVKDDAKGDVSAALKKIANNLAVALSGNALATVAALGARSGRDFEASKKGKVNITIAANGAEGETDITDAKELLEWVRKHADSQTLDAIGGLSENILNAFGGSVGPSPGGGGGGRGRR